MLRQARIAKSAFKRRHNQQQQQTKTSAEQVCKVQITHSKAGLHAAFWFRLEALIWASHEKWLEF